MMTFAWPWAFILFPLPLLIYRWVRPAPQRDAVALKVPFFKSLSVLNQETLSGKSWLNRKYILAILIWSLLILALAGPQWLGPPVALPRSGRNILLAVDLSGSMSLPDFTFGGHSAERIDVVKNVAGRFIEGRKGDRIGLLFFGTKPYLRTPLTYDLLTVKNALDDASIGLAGELTAIGDGIGLAVKKLSDYPHNSRVLILLTDGGNDTGALTPEQGAELAQDAKIRIYTIGIGADRLYIPSPFGTQVINPSSDLDEESLKQIAQMTGGKFFRAKDTQSLQTIYQQIDQLEPISTDTAVLRPTHELYSVPLSIAFCCGMLMGLRRCYRAWLLTTRFKNQLTKLSWQGEQ